MQAVNDSVVLDGPCFTREELFVGQAGGKTEDAFKAIT